ncbi:hypothetical protein SAMN05660841_02723 [Sphingobacterium nematocida]|uniref:Uncharacterized protein n=1 Tax=Sphingobacterium nematocida TaxID=1513896 RepID=A0A1T5EQL6_9SPHI|nr:hypothetical protein [Sphingobacterium nematocida]SKB86237.1 hypothetical protein SAMN05660841_02723 [Sphingobacterium nematocida]
MKKSEVPQDSGRIVQKGSRELYYAVDENGEYTTALSTGWEAKNIVQDHTMQVLQFEIDEAKANVKEGKISPIYYFMLLTRMDIGVLSGYTGFWKWRIKRHFQPQIFERLNNRQLQRYAGAFDITVVELKSFKGD